MQCTLQCTLRKFKKKCCWTYLRARNDDQQMRHCYPRRPCSAPTNRCNTATTSQICEKTSIANVSVIYKHFFGRKIVRPNNCSAETLLPEKKYPSDKICTCKSRGLLLHRSIWRKIVRPKNIISSAEKMFFGILETRLSRKCNPSLWFHPSSIQPFTSGSFSSFGKTYKIPSIIFH